MFFDSFRVAVASFRALFASLRLSGCSSGKFLCRSDGECAIRLHAAEQSSFDFAIRVRLFSTRTEARPRLSRASCASGQGKVHPLNSGKVSPASSGRPFARDVAPVSVRERSRSAAYSAMERRSSICNFSSRVLSQSSRAVFRVSRAASRNLRLLSKARCAACKECLSESIPEKLGRFCFSSGCHAYSYSRRNCITAGYNGSAYDLTTVRCDYATN